MLKAREVIAALKGTDTQGGLSPTGKADRFSDCAPVSEDAARELINERKEQIEVPPCADRLQAIAL